MSSDDLERIRYKATMVAMAQTLQVQKLQAKVEAQLAEVEALKAEVKAQFAEANDLYASGEAWLIEIGMPKVIRRAIRKSRRRRP